MHVVPDSADYESQRQSVSIEDDPAMGDCSRSQGGAGLLNLQELLTDAAFAETPLWWSQLTIIGRLRGSWVFHEPAGIPGAPGAMPR